MEQVITKEEKLFREEASTWLEENVPKEKRPPFGKEANDFDIAWQKKQHAAGWAGLSWPVEYGGRGLPLDLQVIWFEEYARAEAPEATNTLYVGLNHAGPTLIACGTPEQQDFHLPKILSAEAVWCQGFSEPNAGSDLAALRTRGELDGDDIVVTGQKIWTSNGHYSKYQELLIRTDPSAPKHKGITWVIGQMDLPGVDIRPIRNMAGGAHFCEVFYDEVRIPKSNIVGALNDGWRVAMSTLGFERGTASMAHQIELTQFVEILIDFARDNLGPDGKRAAIRHDDIRQRLAVARAEVSALRAITLMSISRARRGDPPGPEGSITRLFHTELMQRVHRLAIDLLGPDVIAMPGTNDWTRMYLEQIRQTIAGGTSEVQRNIIGERYLGLPRQPGPKGV
jgi:alkylation response protein AidB-like acyl-CoA dehydrogenase